ncbi:hypothetical protein P170DRAFT_364955 [Aspergillus steynii IBT 23096]|uniref:Ell binding protein Ebp1 C-terminal domain-containing protein n=1 Tax=Aspergillus steynii IBT 23096 TaxID=1392250 RepID=A0A2I2FXJ2_9EURO|nr:uncharacterized protein P170DRAFT_364955 [Aspergillus steynii IBT 23096]PLB45355.1 hypothetical protein P170DRAFT_364955 [Aspergillus steynii IBT 23096]
MSVNRPPRPAHDQRRIPRPKPSERQPAPGQESIDRRLKRLREDVLPFYPFLLTVPTDVPFRLGGRFVNNWAVSNEGPFTPEEQQLQYMTFLTHHEGDSLLVAVGDWSDGKGAIMPDRPEPQSAASTPSSGSIKKKISLNDYKNKRKPGESASPVSREINNYNAGGIDDGQRVLRGESIEYRPHKKSNNPALSQFAGRSDFESAERKRHPDSENGRSESRERKEPTVTHSKRPRLSPDGVLETNKPERSKARELPVLLSPTLPPTTDSPRLPRLLSPTLPPDIEKELARLEEGPCYLNPPQIKPATNAELGNVQFNKDKDCDDRDKHLASTLTIGRRGTNSKSSMPTLMPDTSDIPQTSSISPASGKSTTLDMSGNPHLVVRLKYGRSNKKRVEALLRFSGKRKPAPTNSPIKGTLDSDFSQFTKMEPNAAKTPAPEPPNGQIHRPDHKAKPVAATQGNVSAADRSGESRVHLPGKSQTLTSPASNPQQQEKAKRASRTLGKEVKDLSARPDMVGIEDNTPPAVKDSAIDSVAVVKLSPSRAGDRRAWRDEYQKYGNLGRELKHAAERHKAKDNPTAVDEKLAVATAIEAILCFILAFVADDQSKILPGQVGDSSSWLSILAYWRVVKKNSTSYRRLYSLCSILGAVSYDAIHSLDLERLAVTPLPGENPVTPTPSSDECNTTREENKRNRREIQELKSRLPECYKESQRLWLEGSRGLSEDILTREFPNTWSKRSKDFSEQGKQRLKAGNYSGEYFLPLGKTNSPVEIVRFGYAVLKEWCMNEGVDWSGHLDL